MLVLATLGLTSCSDVEDPMSPQKPDPPDTTVVCAAGELKLNISSTARCIALPKVSWSYITLEGEESSIHDGVRTNSIKIEF